MSESRWFLRLQFEALASAFINSQSFMLLHSSIPTTSARLCAMQFANTYVRHAEYPPVWKRPGRDVRSSYHGGWAGTTEGLLVTSTLGPPLVICIRATSNQIIGELLRELYKISN